MYILANMGDKFTKKVRSKIMSSIKSKNTWPEKEVRSYLHRHGYRFVLHDKRLPGKPDIVLPKYKTVVEVNGCFWHGHKCKGSKLPSTNKKFWEKKINNNIRRFKKNSLSLRQKGWRVIVIWECQVKKGNIKKLDSI